MSDRLLIVDGNSIANRAFYALPFLSNHKGEPSGAVFGFANILIKIINQENPTYVVIAFDHARKTFRNELYSEYKMQRKATPEELISQFPRIKEMLESMQIKIVEQAGIEADDIIGTIAKNTACEKIILSGDRDLVHLLDDKTTVWLTKKGVSEVDKVDKEQLKSKYNMIPEQVIDLKALMGDASDNIPGVKGVGEKTALSLIEEYGNLDNVYNNIETIKGKLKELKPFMGFINRRLCIQLAKLMVDFNVTVTENAIILQQLFLLASSLDNIEKLNEVLSNYTISDKSKRLILKYM